MSSFKELGLSQPILKVVKDLGFEQPTEIQEKSIPYLLQDDADFIGLAQTGTGKTAAFGLPLLDRIDPFETTTQALILAPTRELGQQIAQQLKEFSKYLEKVNIEVVYGGANIATQIKALKKTTHIVVATPGRLLDLLNRKAVKLNNLQYLILDEADEMLNMGFKEDIDKILSHTPEFKLTWLFSATMPKEIRNIVHKYMHNPHEVTVNAKNEVNVDITHQYTVVNQKDKAEALKRFLDIDQDIRGVVFCRTKRETQNLAEKLLKLNYRADALHGDLSQNQRDRVMKRFKDRDLQVLIATDVAARGIDVNDLTHVFHFSLPDDLSYYTHRSGRTARAGKKGLSIAFVSGREEQKIKRIEKALKIHFEKVQAPDAEEITHVRIEKWCQDVLDKGGTQFIDPWLLDQVNMMFSDLSKEELTAKFLKFELDRLEKGITKKFEGISTEKSKDGGDKDRGGRRDRSGKGDRKGDRRGDRKGGDRKGGDKKGKYGGDRSKGKKQGGKKDYGKKGGKGAPRGRKR